MIDGAVFDLICADSSEICSSVSGCLNKDLEDALGGRVSELFPQFLSAFPEMVRILEEKWSKPVAVYKNVSGFWLAFVVSQVGDSSVFFRVQPSVVDVKGELFDLSHSMLPSRWVEIYRYFDSFAVTQQSYCPMRWLDTPFRYSGRLGLDEYQRHSGVKKAVIRSFADRIGSKQLCCWLRTESGDALFIDEERRDRKVYHVKDDRFDDFCVLEDPGNVLDRYLAHYLSTLSSQGFNFRG
ncbi:hypothetical protein ACX3YG_10195 [Pseudomonas wadenswilerensis]